MRRENVISTISVGVVLIVVLAFAWYFMGGMLDVLRRGQGVAVGATTNVVMRATIPLNMSGAENKVEGSDASIISAYDSLSNELASWMAIMGLFAAVFGLLIPIGSYLLQQRSLKEERDRIKDDVDVMRGIQKDVDNLKVQYEELQGAFKQTNKPFWAALERCFEYSVISNPIASGMYHLKREFEVANLLLSMELMLDGCVLVGDGELLGNKIGICNLIVSKLKKDAAVWNAACEIVRGDGERTPLVGGVRYLRIVKSESAEYRWLKAFFAEIAPDKLP